MNPAQPIRFRKTRDIGEVITATLEFVRENFKPLGKALLTIVGPVVFVSVILGALMQMSFLSAILSGYGSDYGAEDIGSTFLSILGTGLLLTVGALVIFTLATAVVYSYLVLYMDEGTEHLDVPSVWRETKRNFFRLLWTFLGIGIMWVIASFVAALIPILGVLVLYIGDIYVGVTLSLVGIIRVREDVTISESISRSFDLVRGNWWRTALVVYIAYILVTTVSFDLMVPPSLLLWGYRASVLDADSSTTTSILIVVLFLIPAITMFLLYPIPLIAIAVQYFNLMEQKEGAGLLERVEEFGADLQSAGELPS